MPDKEDDEDEDDEMMNVASIGLSSLISLQGRFAKFDDGIHSAGMS